MKAFTAQYRLELTLSLRNGEQLLVNVLIPLGILLFFSRVDVLGDSSRGSVQELVPAVLALAVMSSSLVSLGVGTGFERFYGVLKRLGVTPLGRPRWLVAKLAMVATIEAIQFAILIPTGLALGWEPQAGWLAALGATALATLAFGGIAMLLAGVLPGMLNLAVCNGLYLVLLLTGGMVVPLDEMPSLLSAGAKLLPAASLADIMTGSLSSGHSVHGGSWLVLAAWAVAAPLLAARFFSWD